MYLQCCNSLFNHPWNITYTKIFTSKSDKNLNPCNLD